MKNKTLNANNLRLPKRIFFLSLIVLMCMIACEDFVDIEPPTNQLTGQLVFEDPATVDAAFAHIYGQLRDQAFSTGSISGTSYLMAHYADELELFSNDLPSVQGFTNSRVPASDSSVALLWNTAFELIYATNSIIEGVEGSNILSDQDKDQFLGEAYFLRAYMHFNLSNLFGNIPYIVTTDYRINSETARSENSMVLPLIESDLLQAKTLLSNSEGRIGSYRPNHSVNSAFLARVYVYQEQWSKAMNEAAEVLDGGPYSLTDNLDIVFKKNSPETLWQLDSDVPGNNTEEASTFVFTSGPPPNSTLSTQLSNGFEADDARFMAWVGTVSDGDNTWYFPNKYQLNTPTADTEEYSILIRLPELYLIAAEAHAHLGNIEMSLDYINAIRNRAALPSISTSNPNDLLEAILQERKAEFFTEQGHRFFDLKRTGRATPILSPIKPDWKSSSLVLPIPQSELLLNPNLGPQNEGY